MRSGRSGSTQRRSCRSFRCHAGPLPLAAWSAAVSPTTGGVLLGGPARSKPKLSSAQRSPPPQWVEGGRRSIRGTNDPAEKGLPARSSRAGIRGLASAPCNCRSACTGREFAVPSVNPWSQPTAVAHYRQPDDTERAVSATARPSPLGSKCCGRKSSRNRNSGRALVEDARDPGVGAKRRRGDQLDRGSGGPRALNLQEVSCCHHHSFPPGYELEGATCQFPIFQC